MKKKTINKFGICVISIVIIAISFIIYNSQSNKMDEIVNVTLANIEAFADNGEYSTGPSGTNWKTYTITCTYTKNNGSGVLHLGVLGSWGYESNTSTTWTETKEVCGSGWGTCLATAGC